MVLISGTASDPGVKWNKTVDSIVALVTAVLISLFFACHKAYKVMLLCLAFYGIFISLVTISVVCNAPITGMIGMLCATVISVAILLVYDRGIRMKFFRLVNVKNRLPKDMKSGSEREVQSAADEIIKACNNMAKTRTGALIGILPTAIPDAIMKTGTIINSAVTAPLIESIFYVGTPMHDGAMLIKGNHILAAGCFLPLSQNQALSKSLGTRHRAGIGISEESDMVTIIVSEGTGVISIAEKGDLIRGVSADDLKDVVYHVLGITPEECECK